MSGSYNHTNPASGYTNYSGRPVYIMAIGETRGGCFDCPGKNIDKTNNYGCENCARLGKGKKDCWNPLEYRERPEPPCTPNSIVNLTECAMPDCTRVVKNKYCSTCTSRRNNRKGQWKRLGNEGDAPEWFLNRPKDRNGWNKRLSKYKYHPDDNPHQPINEYDKKLAKAQSLGFESYKAMTIAIYKKHRSLKGAGREIGMSWGGLRSWLLKINYPLFSVGGSNNAKK